MRFVSDKPSDKGEPKTLNITNPVLGKVAITGYEYPQIDSIEELETFAGNKEGALEFINSAIRQAAINNGRAKVANKEYADGDVTEENRAEVVGKLLTETLSTIRDYTPTTDSTRGPTQKEKGSQRDMAKDLAEKAAKEGRVITPEELLALFESSK